MRLQESLHFFYLNLDTTAADNIILSAFDSETKFFHLIIYIGFYFHYIVRYQGLSTDLWSIYHQTSFLGLTDFHTIERLVPFAVMCCLILEIKMLMETT